AAASSRSKSMGTADFRPVTPPRRISAWRVVGLDIVLGPNASWCEEQARARAALQRREAAPWSRRRRTGASRGNGDSGRASCRRGAVATACAPGPGTSRPPRPAPLGRAGRGGWRERATSRRLTRARTADWECRGGASGRRRRARRARARAPSRARGRQLLPPRPLRRGARRSRGERLLDGALQPELLALDAQLVGPLGADVRARASQIAFDQLHPERDRGDVDAESCEPRIRGGGQA